MKLQDIRKLLKLREHRKRMDSLQHVETLKHHAAAQYFADAQARECEHRVQRAFTGQQALYAHAVGKELRVGDLDALHYRADEFRGDASAAIAGAEKAKQELKASADRVEQSRRVLTRSSYRVFKTEKLSDRGFREAARLSEVREELDLADTGGLSSKKKALP